MTASEPAGVSVRKPLLERIGTSAALGGFVVGAAVLRDGTVTVGLGNGPIALAAMTEGDVEVQRGRFNA